MSAPAAPTYYRRTTCVLCASPRLELAVPLGPSAIGNDQMTNGAALPNTTNDWHLAGVGDFNGDGTSDIFWHSDSGQNLIWNIGDDQLIRGARGSDDRGTVGAEVVATLPLIGVRELVGTGPCAVGRA